MSATATAVAAAPPPAVDLAAVKERQRAAWASGDYARIGTTLDIVGESLCETLDLRAGSRVLDVAAGNGNVTLAAARRFAEVTSTDYVPALLERGHERALAERLPAVFQEADAEALPFPDDSFDVVVSTFGVMFAPDHARAAAEMFRVCRPGGRIGLANWTPDGFIGHLFKLIGRAVPPPPGVASPALWGTEAHLRALFPKAAAIAVTPRVFTFRYPSPEAWIRIFRDFYGPVHKAFAALDAEARAGLETELHALLARFDRSGDATLVVPSDYVEVVIGK